MERMNEFLKSIAGAPFGFHVDEVMSGWHEFEPGCGDSGQKKMEFRVRWGAGDMAAFLNPFHPGFCEAKLQGEVDIEGLCRAVPVAGTLQLRYFRDAKIRYEFSFDLDGTPYDYAGEKVNIRPWNAYRTHTTCYGVLRRPDTGAIVSRSVTHFRWSTLPAFLASVRLATPSQERAS